jgi:hypothetical protein
MEEEILRASQCRGNESRDELRDGAEVQILFLCPEFKLVVENH